MPHQCVRCGNIYDDGSKEILSGCICGAKLFFYIRKERLQQAKEITQNLSNEDKKQIETDVFKIMGREDEEDVPVVLDIESVRVLKPGKFELDLVHLFNKKNPLVYKLDEGKYIIDIAETFKRNADSKKKKKK
jgi:hypothetical protein